MLHCFAICCYDLPKFQEDHVRVKEDGVQHVGHRLRSCVRRQRHAYGHTARVIAEENAKNEIAMWAAKLSRSVFRSVTWTSHHESAR